MKKTKAIIAGVALVAALGIFILVGSGEESLPDTDDTRTQWICLACQKPFTLTAAEFEDASRNSGKAFVVNCPACSELKGVRAVQCASCKEIFATTDAEGQDMACPKCNPVIVTTKKEAQEDAPEAEVAPEEEAPPADRPIMFVQ